MSTARLNWKKRDLRTHTALIANPLNGAATMRFIIRRDKALRYRTYIEDLKNKRTGGFNGAFPTLLEAQMAAQAFYEARELAAGA